MQKVGAALLVDWELYWMMSANQAEKAYKRLHICLLPNLVSYSCICLSCLSFKSANFVWVYYTSVFVKAITMSFLVPIFSKCNKISKVHIGHPMPFLKFGEDQRDKVDPAAFQEFYKVL